MLTAERLRELLDYDPATGKFLWKVRLSNRQHIGGVAGFCRRGGRYTEIRIDRKLYLGHRLAWLYVHGRWPEGEIDHAVDYTDRIQNIRIASSSQNKANVKRRNDNTSGFKGVSKKRRLITKPWQARININGVEKYLGYFASAVEAAEAYDVAAVRIFGNFARTNKMLGILC